ncbi:MAG: DUF3048 domain-containing protein [Kyrpidia sp.]|nr:DUF3048 domain-containing protein [Kyrpidia sp.]
MQPPRFTRFAAVVAGLAGVALAACGQTSSPSPAPAPVPVPAPAPVTPPPAPPLGGTLAIMVDNLREARPQAGIDRATAVVEALAEGPITRFEVFVDHRIEKIGPVRSLRPYFATLAQPLGAPVAHAGGSPDALNMVRLPGWPDLDEIYNAAPAFWRDPRREPPHNLYTSTDKLLAMVQQKGYPLGEPIPIPRGAMASSGTAVKDIRLRWYSYSASWTWDGRHYVRSEDGTPHTTEDGTRVQADNIAVIVAPDRIVDQAGRRQIILTGSGQAWFFRSGQAYQGTWSRSAAGWFQFYTGNEPMRWSNGPVWIEVISNPSWLTTNPI